MRTWRRRIDDGARRRGIVLAFAAAVLLSFSACSSTLSVFDATAYKQATDLKAESLALMVKATQPASEHAASIEQLRLDLSKAIEYERGRPKNAITTRMWEILADSSGHLLGGFLARWESDGMLRAAFVTEARLQVGEAFDQIIGLESGKLKEDDVKGRIFPDLF